MKKSAHTYWLTTEIEFIRKRYLTDNINRKDIAEEMGCKESQIRNLLIRLKISKPSPKLDLVKLKALWDKGAEPREISIVLGKSLSCILDNANKLNLPKRTVVRLKRPVQKRSRNIRHSFKPKKVFDFQDLPHEPGKTSLLKVGPNQCRHITGGTADDGSPKCCGHRAIRHSYCIKHFAQFYITDTA